LNTPYQKAPKDSTMANASLWIKWLLTLLGVGALVGLGLTTRMWLPWLLPFLDDQGDRWQSLASLVQVIMWGAGALFLFWRLWFSREKTPVPTTVHHGNFAGRDYITQIYHTYQSGPGQPQLNEDEFAVAVSRYLEWVQHRYGHLNLKGIASREHRVLSLTLEDVYVSLLAAVTPEREGRLSPASPRRAEMAEMAEMERAEPRIVDMADLLALGERLAIIGGPGSGKTTFLHIIAVSIAQALNAGDNRTVARHLGLTGDLPLPIFLTLGDYNRYRKAHQNPQNPHQGTLTAYISYGLINQEAGLGLPEDFFVRLLRGGKRCIVLLDGLDEVADEDDRKLVRQAIENLAANPGVGQMLVTSRSRAYTDQSVLGQAFQVATVQPMSLEQAQTLADRWCHAAYTIATAKAESQSLQTAIANLERLREERGDPPLIDSPLMVTIVAIVHDEGGRLPDERADLYQRCVRALLAESHKPAPDQIELATRGGSETEKRSLLTYLAFCMMAAGEARGRRVDEDQVKAWLHPQLVKLRGAQAAGPALDAFLEAVASRGSLLNERSRVYEFIHLTFQEFLCAAYLVDTVRERDEIVRLLFDEEHIAQSWWRETVLLTVGYLGLGSIDAPLALVTKLATQPATAGVTVGAVEVAAAAFLEQNGRDPETRDLLVKRLVALIEEKAHPGSPQQRLAAGKRLGQLGDPRPGVGLRTDGPSTGSGQRLPDIAWVEIPEMDAQGRREFLYGEKGERRVEPTFWMAKYPITYRQFHAFVDDPDGMANPRWWQGLARTDNDDLGEQAFEFWNHPRERVTWYQAVAFCRWLTAQAKAYPDLLPPQARAGAWRITLPTEWQWEKAARGHHGRLYPWGAEYIQGYANVDETKKGDGPHKLQSTSAVGLYPQGATPEGILDLSGNVWEWCLNEYANPERFQESGDERRALRGGSWYWDAASASASARSWFLPWYRDADYGFRVVVVPISR
jgi:formylglycine-generating enzyme required for sulfatase activity